mmetsp:Transcript_12329/g.20466  ORF Transcript_12329/g.20466 Transcript_12329/m.20466 type:complete len:219 (-) Transcript_12329:99-755(-)
MRGLASQSGASGRRGSRRGCWQSCRRCCCCCFLFRVCDSRCLFFLLLGRLPARHRVHPREQLLRVVSHGGAELPELHALLLLHARVRGVDCRAQRRQSPVCMGIGRLVVRETLHHLQRVDLLLLLVGLVERETAPPSDGAFVSRVVLPLLAAVDALLVVVLLHAGGAAGQATLVAADNQAAQEALLLQVTRTRHSLFRVAAALQRHAHIFDQTADSRH